MQYMFVLKDKGLPTQGWWLKISTLEELKEYDDNVESSRIARGFDSFLHSKEFGIGDKHCSKLGWLIALESENTKTSPMMAACTIANRSLALKTKYICEGYDIYINRVGGWNYGKHEYTDWCRRDKLIFPDFKKNDIKIEQFPGGEHFYAYIDDMQVRDGDKLKWDSYEEAYAYASALITETET